MVLVAHPKKTNAAFDNDTVSGSSDITNAVSFVLNYQRAAENADCDGLLMVTKKPYERQAVDRGQRRQAVL